MNGTTLALGGGAQTQLSTSGLRQVADDVRETTIPDAGRYVQEERPAEFADALQRFVG